MTASLPNPAPDFFLPIARETVQRFVTGDLPADQLDTLSLAELCALLVLQNLEGLQASGKTAASAEIILSKGLENALAIVEQAPGAFVQAVASRVTPRQVHASRNAVEAMNIGFLREGEVREERYLTRDGRWDFSFTRQYVAKLNPLQVEVVTPVGRVLQVSDHQARSLTTFNLEIDESSHHQACAGSGKTFMIVAAMDYLPHKTTLLLAYSTAQLDALKARIGPTEATFMTIGDLASRTLNGLAYLNPRWRVGERGMSRHPLVYKDIAKKLGFLPVADLRPDYVAAVCWRAIGSFCNSSATEVGVEHLPWLGGSLADADRAYLLACARAMWEQILEPAPDGPRLPIRGYHRIKDMALSNVDIPRQYTHILMDETHDLPAPMVEVFERSTRGVSTFGDEFQHLGGIACQRSDRTRHRFIHRSLRNGQEIEEIINPLILSHPGKTKVPFEGRRDQRMRIHYYTPPFIPTKPTALLVGSMWSMWEWFQYLSKAGGRFRVLPGSDQPFRNFVGDIVNLYTDNVRPTSSMLMGYGSWTALSRKFGGLQEFKRIAKMLEQGYTLAHFDRALTSCSGEPGAIELGLVDQVRNWEFDSVTLAPDVLHYARGTTPKEHARRIAAVYVGCTRARHELHLPLAMREWIEGGAPAEE